MHHEVDPGRNSAVGNWWKGSKMKRKREKERLAELLDDGERLVESDKKIQGVFFI